MKGIVIGILKSIFNEDTLKAVLLALGDYLVAKSSNKLDDALWSKVKDRLNA